LVVIPGESFRDVRDSWQIETEPLPNEGLP
jgi:hypothetical protein